MILIPQALTRMIRGGTDDGGPGPSLGPRRRPGVESRPHGMIGMLVEERAHLGAETRLRPVTEARGPRLGTETRVLPGETRILPGGTRHRAADADRLRPIDATWTGLHHPECGAAGRYPAPGRGRPS
jgi:hypothetical protein